MSVFRAAAFPRSAKWVSCQGWALCSARKTGTFKGLSLKSVLAPGPRRRRGALRSEGGSGVHQLNRQNGQWKLTRLRTAPAPCRIVPGHHSTVAVKECGPHGSWPRRENGCGAKISFTVIPTRLGQERALMFIARQAPKSGARPGDHRCTGKINRRELSRRKAVAIGMGRFCVTYRPHSPSNRGVML
jgi:hypothetical protein